MRLFVLFTLLLLSAIAVPAMAQGTIHRCIDAHGNPLFTDQPCTSMQASPVKAQAAPAASTASTTPADAPMKLCPRTPDELRQDVVNAFATRDPNRLAGLMLWHGYGRDAVIGDIRSLARLVQQPLLDLHVGSDNSESNNPAPAASAIAPAINGSSAKAHSPEVDDELVLDTSGSDGTHTTRFAIDHRAGCLWLRYAD